MSFGVSISDIGMLVQLAWRTAQNIRNASNEYEELSCATLSLHATLRRLEAEVQNPKSLLNKPDDPNRQEIEIIGSGCRKTLTALDKILEKYRSLNGGTKGIPKVWQKFRFGNEDMTIKDIRDKMTYYTSVLSLYLNMVSIGSSGRVERHMEAAGGELKELKSAVNAVTAHLMSNAKEEGSVMTMYADDDRAVWREFRRELVKQGFRSSLLHKHKTTIQSYLAELGERGLMDDTETNIAPTLTPSTVSERHPNKVSAPLVHPEAMSHSLSPGSNGHGRVIDSISSQNNHHGDSIAPDSESAQAPAIGASVAPSASEKPQREHVKEEKGLSSSTLVVEPQALAEKPPSSKSIHRSIEWQGRVERQRWREMVHHEFLLQQEKWEQWRFADIWHPRRRWRIASSSFENWGFLASPHGICCVYKDVDVSTLFADFELRFTGLKAAFHHYQGHVLEARREASLAEGREIMCEIFAGSFFERTDAALFDGVLAESNGTTGERMAGSVCILFLSKAIGYVADSWFEGIIEQVKEWLTDTFFRFFDYRKQHEQLERLSCADETVRESDTHGLHLRARSATMASVPTETSRDLPPRNGHLSRLGRHS